MTKKITLFGISAVACVLSMSSCTSVGEHKTSAELYYTNITKADNEELTFLRTVYKAANDEVAFADIISQRGTNAQIKSLAADLGAKYKAMQTKIEAVAKSEHVIIPNAAMPAFELPAGLDSAQSAVLEKAYLEQSVHNQETMVEQFEIAARNTRKVIQDYASEVLPSLDKNLEETKSLL